MARSERLTATSRSLRARLSPQRFRRDEKGATVVEFGLLALPFFALIFAILQVGLVFFAGQTLDTAVANAARLIRTGQAQQQAFNLSTFKSQICSQVSALFTSCTTKLQLDVRTFATFDKVDLTMPVDQDGKLKTDQFTYSPGHGGEIVVVRAFYEWPTFSKLLGFNLSNLSNGNHLLAATAAFRNEPFPW